MCAPSTTYARHGDSQGRAVEVHAKGTRQMTGQADRLCLQCIMLISCCCYLCAPHGMQHGVWLDGKVGGGMDHQQHSRELPHQFSLWPSSLRERSTIRPLPRSTAAAAIGHKQQPLPPAWRCRPHPSTRHAACCAPPRPLSSRWLVGCHWAQHEAEGCDRCAGAARPKQVATAHSSGDSSSCSRSVTPSHSSSSRLRRQ